MKFSIFKAEKSLCILHGQVFIMIANGYMLEMSRHSIVHISLITTVVSATAEVNSWIREIFFFTNF